MGKLPSSLSSVLMVAMLAVFNSGYAQEAQRTAILENVNVVPMTKNSILRDYRVTITNGVITSISPSSKGNTLKSGQVIDCKGAYLIPGLADMHMHLESIERENWPTSQLGMYIAHGVTTVRDLDGRQFIGELRDSIANGGLLGPTIITYPPIIRGYEKDYLELIQKYSDEGYRGVKLYGYFSLDDFRKAMRKTRELKLHTIGHIPFNVGLDAVVSENMNEIAHIIEIAWEFADLDRADTLDALDWFHKMFDSIESKYGSLTDEELEQKLNEDAARIVSRLKGAGITVNTTLIVERLVRDKVCHADTFLHRPLNRYLPEGFFCDFALGYNKHQLMYENRENAAQLCYKICEAILGELKRQNIPIVLGTDAGSQSLAVIPGASVHEELEILAENGFSPYEALSTATRDAGILMAQITGKNEIGTIEEGKRADLVLVDKNPLESIDFVSGIRGVMVRGKWYEREQLDEMIEMNQEAIQFRTDFWETVFNCVHYDKIEPLSSMLMGKENATLRECGYNAVFKYYLDHRDFERLPDAFGKASEFTLDRVRRVQLLNAYAWFIYENRWRQQYPEGIRAAKQAVELYPNYAGLFDTLGRLYFENNQVDDAIKAMKQAIALAPNRKELRDNLEKMEKSRE